MPAGAGSGRRGPSGGMSAFRPNATPTHNRVEGRQTRPGAGSVVPRRIAELATAQRGVVSLDQLRDLGVSDDTAESWLELGWLHRLHEGVYAVGHRALDDAGRFMAAVLAGGRGAALSHVSAAIHLGLLQWRPRDVDVMVPRGGERGRPGIHFHRPRVFGPDDVEEVNGILCTTVARTLVDLAGVLKPLQLERAIARAEYLGVLDVKEVAAVLARITRPRGVRHLRRILGPDRIEGSAAESGLEREYHRLVLDAGIEPPVLQAPFRLGPERWARVDFHWPRQSLVVEIDGPHHALPIFAAADASRDAALRRMGLRVQRFTDVDLETNAASVIDATRRLLASRDDRPGSQPGQSSLDAPTPVRH